MYLIYSPFCWITIIKPTHPFSLIPKNYFLSKSLRPVGNFFFLYGIPESFFSSLHFVYSNEWTSWQAPASSTETCWEAPWARGVCWGYHEYWLALGTWSVFVCVWVCLCVCVFGSVSVKGSTELQHYHKITARSEDSECWRNTRPRTSHQYWNP